MSTGHVLGDAAPSSKSSPKQAAKIAELPFRLLLVLLLTLPVFLTPQRALATAYHAITIDGVNDFAADEDVPGTSGSTWYFTWDAQNLYFGINASDVGSGASSRWVLLYIDIDPRPDPLTGDGSSTGVHYNTQQPGLPFRADYHLRWKADNTYTNLMRWDSGTSSWVDAGTTEVQIFQSGPFLEGRLSRSSLGEPTAVQIVGTMINEQAGGEWTFFMTPSANGPDGYDKDFSHYFGFVLSDYIHPDAATSLDCHPVNLISQAAQTGPGSLSAAISTLCDGGRILPSLPTPSTIHLTSELVIDRNLKIIGDGSAPENLVFSGQHTTRVFHITADHVTLSGLTVQDGQTGNTPGNDCGGGILVDVQSPASDSLIILNNLVVTGNTASACGGGLAVLEGKVSLESSRIYLNSAPSGGGVYVAEDSFTASAARIRENSATVAGGGVYIQGDNSAPVTFTAGQIAWNTAPDGAGAFLAQTQPVFNNVLLVYNTASNDGGGLYAGASSRLTLNTTSQVNNNSASRGGGIFLGAVDAALILNDGIIGPNTASQGAGLYQSGGTATLTGGAISENNASAVGDGIYLENGILNLNGTPVSNNGLESDSECEGIYVQGGTLEITAGQIINNHCRGIRAADGILNLAGGEVIFDASQGEIGLLNTSGSVTLGATQIKPLDPYSNDGTAFRNSGDVFIETDSLTIIGDVFQLGGTFDIQYAATTIDGSLSVSGGTFLAPTSFTIIENFSHSGGVYVQSRSVSGSGDVGFPKAGGVVLNAQGNDLGPTEVVIRAGQECTSVAGEAVRHCYSITPANPTGQNATIAFYYFPGEIPTGQACNAMNAFHWLANAWDGPLTLDEPGSRLCSSAPYALRVKNVSSFSPFVLRAAVEGPTAVHLLDMAGHTQPLSTWIGGLAGAAALLGFLAASLVRKKK